MMDWTDRHCRFLHRLLTRRTRLYTEMVTTGALIHGDVRRHLAFEASVEHPVALQLGGSEPRELAIAARMGEAMGYDEVNLNCGCPSERVQRGSFGACLMAEPALVAQCVAAMRDAVRIPVTVKHRIGLGRDGSYAFVRDFVGTVGEAGGADVFVVHARNAWLEGLSPKQNREVPPLRYEVVDQLRADFPAHTFVLNGGIASNAELSAALASHAGAMVGRFAYHEPAAMATWDRDHLGDTEAAPPGVGDVEAAYVRYLERVASSGEPWTHASRHMLGLRHGEPGARRWRQVWSDATLHGRRPGEVARMADAARRAAVVPALAA
jgi:tRNA-dihydrouridine synthase A